MCIVRTLTGGRRMKDLILARFFQLRLDFSLFEVLVLRGLVSWLLVVVVVTVVVVFGTPLSGMWKG